MKRQTFYSVASLKKYIILCFAFFECACMNSFFYYIKVVYSDIIIKNAWSLVT